MAEAFTSKVYIAGKTAPKRIQLFGDKTKKVEAAQHVIEFPGGAIEVSRTTEGDYWAHLLINRDQAIEECDGRCQSLGEIVDSRITSDGGVVRIPEQQNITQIALLIKPVRS